MKLSINPGPGNLNNGVNISVDHRKQLTNVLWDWESSLPKEVATHIDIVVVKTYSRGCEGGRIEIKVVLSGKYKHYGVPSVFSEPASWGNCFDVDIAYSPNSTEQLLISELGEKLSAKLLTTLEQEHRTAGLYFGHMDFLCVLMKKN